MAVLKIVQLQSRCVCVLYEATLDTAAAPVNNVYN